MKTIVLSYEQKEETVERSILFSATFQLIGTRNQQFIFNMIENEFEEGLLTFTYEVDGEEHIITHRIVNQFFE